MAHPHKYSHNGKRRTTAPHDMRLQSYNYPSDSNPSGLANGLQSNAISLTTPTKPPQNPQYEQKEYAQLPTRSHHSWLTLDCLFATDHRSYIILLILR